MRVTVIATGFIADNSDQEQPEPARVVPAPSIDRVIPQPAPAPVPTFEESFSRVEVEPIPEAPQVAQQPVQNATYESVYGNTFTCITKNKKR
jgi:hypothetical protein